MRKNQVQRLFSLAVLLSIGLLVAGVTWAQEISGNLIGTVRDANGAAIAGATVTISDAGKGNLVIRQTTTNENGEFSAPNLGSSTYTITVEATNFKKAARTGVKVDVGQRRSVDLTLEAGNISEVVTVEADPVAVETTTPTSSTLISGDQAREISLNNRNFTQLVALAPGVSNDLSDQVYTGTVNPEGQANIVSISVNGARSSQNTFTVDGADITDRGSNLTIQAYPSVDSIGEFRVLRALYPAESGRSGGGQVNVVTRSGQRRFSGSAFEFIRNEAFNANDFFSNTSTNPALGRDTNGKAKRRPFRYNNFGFTFGGPVYFFNFGEGQPDGFFKRYEKTFFFFSQEFRRDRRFPTLSSTVPSLALRNGIFPINICLSATISGTTRTCLNTLPAGTPLSSLAPINPIAQQYVNFIYNNLPAPTNAATFALQAPALNIANFRQEVIKIDHTFSKKLSAYYRYQRDAIPTTDVNALFSSGSGLPGVSTTSTDSPGRTHTLQAIYAANPTTIIEGRYTYGFGAILSSNVGTLALANSPIRPPLAFENQRDRVPTVTGNGFSGLTSFGPYDNFSFKKNFTGTLTKIAGSHTLKAGGVYSLYRKNENALAGNNEGIFTGFNNTTLASPTQGNVLASGVTASTLNTNIQAWANFLLGNNVTFTQARFDYTADLRQKAIEAFAQDEWRMRKNLTVYYGVRYSYFGAPWDKNGRLSNFDPSVFRTANAPQVTGAGNRVVGTGNFCNGLIVNAQNYATADNCTPTPSPYGKYVYRAQKADFAPRFGLAWDPFGKGRTSVRTGYGIYHEQVLNGTLLQNIGTNPPYQQTVVIPNTRLDQPVPAGTTPAFLASAAVANLRAVQPDFNTPYMQHWSLDLQHQLDKSTLVTVGYYGSKGTNLIGSYELNLLPPGRALASQCATGANTLQTPGVTTVACQAPGTAFFSSAQELILDQLRPFRGYRSIAMVQPRYNSNYHSLQVSALRRFTGVSQVQLSYTWSRNMTDNQNDRSAAPQNSFNIKDDYARAALDRRHILSVNYIYELPFFRKQTDFVGKVLGGWQASGIVTYNTGLPFTATTSSYDPAGLGLIPPPTTVARPNLLCNPNANAPNTQAAWFNTSCFAINPAVGTTGLANVVGSAGRSTIDGPPTTRVDFTMVKNIRFGEKGTTRIQLRAEAFNIFNKTNFRALSTNVTATTFGQAITTRDPRTLQFAAKVNF